MPAPEQQELTPSHRLYNAWRPYIELYHNYGIKIEILMLFKSLLIILVRSDAFAWLRWLDCLLPGRLLYGSRIPQASQYLAAITWLTFMSNSKLLDDMGAAFNFFCLELTLYNHRHWLHLTDLLPSKWRLHNRLAASEAARAEFEGSALDSEPSQMHFVLREHFRSALEEHQLVDRPTRTKKWRLIFGRMHQIAVLLLAGALLMFLLSNVLLFWPMFLTRRGFELTRENCVRHIVQSAGSADSLYHRFIYRPNISQRLSEIYGDQTIPLVLPYDELVPLNLYHVLRVLFDMLETCLALSVVLLGYWFHLYFGIFFSLDAIIYVRDLHQKLEAATARLWASTVANDALVRAGKCRRDLNDNRFQARGTRRADSKFHRQAILQLQACLVDYLQLVAFYNPLISRVIFTNVTIWLFYCFFIFLRHLRADRLGSLAALDHGVEVEFFALFTFCLLLTILLLGLASFLNAQAGKLYHSIVCLVALEQSGMRQRQRWIAILNHFGPQKLHCFTLFGYADLSWLSCLKLFSWVISALAILMTL